MPPAGAKKEQTKMAIYISDQLLNEHHASSRVLRNIENIRVWTRKLQVLGSCI